MKKEARPTNISSRDKPQGKELVEQKGRRMWSSERMWSRVELGAHLSTLTTASLLAKPTVDLSSKILISIDREKFARGLETV